MGSKCFAFECSVNTTGWPPLNERPSPHPYKIQAELQFCRSSSFYFAIANKTRFCTEWSQAFPDFSLLFISSWKEFWFVRVVPKYLNYSTPWKDLLPAFMLWFCPACWSWNMTIFLVFSAFTSRSSSLLAVTKAPMFLCNSMYASIQYINIISINQVMHTI